MPIGRAKVIQLMRKAFRAKESFNRFYSDLIGTGLRYKKTTMLGDWRSVNELEKKQGLLQYVRKDRIPGKQAIAQVSWEISREYMYVAIVRSQLAPGEPIAEQKVNIMQDRPLTPREVEALTWQMIQKQSPKTIEQVVEIVPWAVVQRIYD